MRQVVYLTPDSTNVLQKIDPSLVYVIGGLVDDTVLKDTSSHFSRSIGLQTARLPIPELMERVEGSGKQVLTINQVFDILVEVNSGGGWAKALRNNVPPKTGFVIKEEKDSDQSLNGKGVQEKHGKDYQDDQEQHDQEQDDQKQRDQDQHDQDGEEDKGNQRELTNTVRHNDQLVMIDAVIKKQGCD